MLVSEILRIKGHTLFTTPPERTLLEAVAELYVRDPLTAAPDLDVMELRRVMLERHARYVPVMDGTTLLGVVSFHDVAKAVYEDQSFENRMLKSYIKNWPDEEATQ